MISVVRERRHQQPLTLSIPSPPPPCPATISAVSRNSTSPSLSTLEDSPVESVNDLEKLTVLGHGGNGTVYKVRHRRTGNLYALKVLRQDDNTDSLEAEILNRISSSFIVKCYAIFKTLNGELCFVMELMEKGSLHEELLVQQVLPEETISNVAKRVLHGLHYLEKMRIVHGDIKPSNLLINDNGEIKIADFGVSKVVEVGNYSPNGTCAYMSPERVDPEKWGLNEDGFAGDVWSLGVVVLECYVGRYPLIPVGDKLDWPTLINAICLDKRVEIPEKASKEFKGFVEKCLEKDWRKRGTVKELLHHPFVYKD